MPSKGTNKERGYGWPHQRRRKAWAPKVATGKVNCWRCGQPIDPTGSWDLGHDDYDRRQYKGPEHTHCNRATKGRQAPPADTTRTW